jgi:hypothetical protein
MKKTKAKIETPTNIIPPGPDGNASAPNKPDAKERMEEEPEQKESFSLDKELERTACLPDSVYKNLPELLKKCVDPFNVRREKDVVLLSALTVLSATIPQVTGMYDGCTVHANFNCYIIAPAASGKGVMAHAKKVGSVIHEQRVQEYNEKMAEYKARRVKKEPGEEKGPAVELPKQTILFIPGNSSSASVITHLNDNDGNGIICETEADSISNVMKQDWGGYSDMVRKAFHHEPISYSRKKDREYYEINSPKLSMLITSTPSQITGLVKSASDGLFSRFLFYAFSTIPNWKMDLFDKNRGNLDEIFQGISEQVESISSFANMVGPVFSFTEDQIEEFNSFFDYHLKQFHKLTGGDSPSFLKRFGLILYRIAMVLSVFRYYNTGGPLEELVCTDEDFQIAKSVIRICLLHNLLIYEHLIKIDEKAINLKGSSLGVNKFLVSVPVGKEHSRAELVEIGKQNKFSESTVDKYLKILAKEGFLVHSNYGKYLKK